MDIEQLKLILDLMQKAGEVGADLFIFYVLIENIPGIIGGGLMIGLLFYIARLCCGLIRTNMAGERLREASGVTVIWSDRELNMAIKCLQTHYKEFKDKEYNLFD